MESIRVTQESHQESGTDGTHSFMVIRIRRVSFILCLVMFIQMLQRRATSHPHLGAASEFCIMSLHHTLTQASGFLLVLG